MFKNAPKSVLWTMGVTGAVPLMVGAASASGAPIPGTESLPMWVILLCMTLGPSIPPTLHFLGKTAMRALAAGLRAVGVPMLTDKNHPEYAIRGKFLTGIADSLDKSADSQDNAEKTKKDDPGA